MNWPAMQGHIGNKKIEVQSQAKVKIDMPTINFLRRWTNLCYSFNFPENEVQMAMNGEVFEKIKDPKTSPGYKGQLGGHLILDEKEDSKFYFSVGRYHFSDLRFVMTLAGINAWNRTLTEEELKSFSGCDKHTDIVGNLINANTDWNVPSSTLVKEKTIDFDEMQCTARTVEKLVAMPIPKDTKQNMIDTCQKYGNNVYLGGTIRNLDDMEHIVKIINDTEQFQKACCHFDDNRCSTWVPYEVNVSGIIVHDTTGEVFDLGKGFYVNFWDGPVKGNPQTVGAYFGKLMDMKERITGGGPTSRL